MLKFIKKLALSIYVALEQLINHDGIEHAGYMAFMSILSLFPFLVFFVALAGFVGQYKAGVELVNFLTTSLPENMIIALKPRLAEILNGPPQGLLTLSILGAIWTASASVEGLRTILNRVYHVSTPPAYVWRRMISIVEFLILTLLSMVAMLILVFFPVVWHGLERVLPQFAKFQYYSDFPLWIYARYSFFGLILFLVVATIYYVLPNAKIKFSSVLPGAALVVFLQLFGIALLSMYINNFAQVNLIYGSLGSVIIALLFFYTMNLILIYGAEFNYQLKLRFGEKDKN
jgi:membrane protein